MNQCVPSCRDNLQEEEEDRHDPSLPRFNFEGHPPSNSLLDYEVAELTWQNGQLTMHGLCPPRLLINKPASTESSSFPKYGGGSTSWDDRPAPPGGTLESLVDQATRPHPSQSHEFSGGHLPPWFDYHRAVAMDALVPCDNNNSNKGSSNIGGGGGKENCQDSTHVLGSGAPPGIGSCSGAGHFVGTGIDVSCSWTNGCASESATCGRGLYSCQAAATTTFATSASMISAGNTMSVTAGKEEYTRKTSGEGHGSGCRRRRSQRERSGNDDRKKKGSGKSSISTKRSRAAAIHNQSERKRRDRINERMRTLQKLVPNSSKQADKASMLDEAIEYLKEMQTQVQVMRRMVPLALQQQVVQMSSMMAAAAAAAAAPPPMGSSLQGMGMGMPSPPLVAAPLQQQQQPSPWDNDVNLIPPAAAPPDCSPADPSSTLLAAFLASCQSQPMNMEAYSRLAAANFQQFQNMATSNAAAAAASSTFNNS